MPQLKFALAGKNVVDAGTEADPPLDTAEFVYSGDIAELKGVAIELFEVDRGELSKDGKEKKRKSLAKFKADIVPNPTPAAGQPPGNLKLTSKPKASIDKDAPRFKLKLGGETFEIGLPDLKEEAGRRFEIQLVAGAKKLKFESKALLFARFGHFKNEVAAPVITFVTGAEDGGFFKAAATYWRQHADVVIERDGLSLEDIAQFLANKNTQIMAETGNKGWGEVNIVCHGNAIQAFIRILKTSRTRDLRISQLDSQLEAQRSAFQLGPLGLTATSRVVFRACDIGRRPDLLKRVKSDVFGGVCPVKAPKFLQVYRATLGASTGRASESFLEDVTLMFPQATEPPVAVADAALGAKFARIQATRKPAERQVFANEKASFTIRKTDATASAFAITDTDTELKTRMQADGKTIITLEQFVSRRLDEQQGTDRFFFSGSKRWLVQPFKGRRTATQDLEVKATSSTATGSLAFVRPGNQIFVGSDQAILDKVNQLPPIRNLLHSPAAGLATGEVVTISNQNPPQVQVTRGATVLLSGRLSGEATLQQVIGSETLTLSRSHSLQGVSVPLARFAVSLRRELRESTPAVPFAQRPLVVPNIDNKQHYGSSEDASPTPAELQVLGE